MIWPRISWALTPKAKRKVMLLISLLLVVVLFVSSNWFWRMLYPIPTDQETYIRQYSHAYQVDPLLLVALIRVESKFSEENVSHVGAIGLMQLMPDTAQWISGQSGIPYHGRQDLADPKVNIQLGAWYLGELSKQFKGNWVAVVAAYNAGPNRVTGWMAKKVWNGRLDSSESIPVGETRQYVQRVFFNYDKYKNLYPDFK